MRERVFSPWNMDATLVVAFGRRTGPLDLAGVVLMELRGPHNKARGEVIGFAAI